MAYQALIDFWFSDENKDRWFHGGDDFDTLIRSRFLDTWQAGKAGELSTWEETPEGALALVILLDQFPLNMFRDQAESYSTEAMAREVAERAIEKGFDRDMEQQQKFFLYLPFMHSEDIDHQLCSIELFSKAGLETRWAIHHCKIIERFGRFPHRNEALGRESTEEEQAYLNSDEAFRG